MQGAATRLHGSADGHSRTLTRRARTPLPLSALARQMKADYFRYLSEFQQGAKKEENGQLAASTYKDATDSASSSLAPTHPIRLGLALNYSVRANPRHNPPPRRRYTPPPNPTPTNLTLTIALSDSMEHPTPSRTRTLAFASALLSTRRRDAACVRAERQHAQPCTPVCGRCRRHECVPPRARVRRSFCTRCRARRTRRVSSPSERLTMRSPRWRALPTTRAGAHTSAIAAVGLGAHYGGDYPLVIV